MTDTPVVPLRGGVAIPLLGLGTWELSGDEAYGAVRDAIDIGYRHVDTATMYRNEQDVGRAVRECGLPRGDVFVTTKLPPQRADRPRETLERSLGLLGLDHVDLWLVHWPPNGTAAPDTWAQLLSLRDEGLVRAVGVSNYSTAQVDELIAATGEAPAVNQIEWSPKLYDASRAGELRDRGVVLEGYSPFKSSDLKNRTMRDIAAAHDKTVQQVILRWHLQHEVVVIPKSSHRDRLAANHDVFDFALTDEEMRRLDALGD